MKVAKWGNSLAVRIPAELVMELGLKEGDEVMLRKEGERDLTVERKPDRKELLKRFEKFRGMMPEGFKFNREEAHERR